MELIERRFEGSLEDYVYQEANGDRFYEGDGPTERIGGVNYELVYGEGCNFDRESGQPYPLYVWKVVGVDMTALPHVSDALYERSALAEYMRHCEAAAGWDPRP